MADTTILAHQLADLQSSLITRTQLRGLGLDSDFVRNQVVAKRWAIRSSTVISTVTGELTWHQRLWLGALHVGADSLVAGLTALKCHGLRNWERDDVLVLAPSESHLKEVPEGIEVRRTRRDLTTWRHPVGELPLARVEPAALWFAAYERSHRTALGLLAAVVQQRLTTPERLLTELESMSRLRRTATFRVALREFAGGAQSLAELDVNRVCRRFGLPKPARQVKRKDSSGRFRFTDCEWLLPDGTTLVLEVDGGFHMEVEHWEDDIVRQRRISRPGRVVVRCTARELRDEPEQVVHDLRSLGLTESCA